MSCGAAVLLTREGGIGEFARDGENCLLVDPLDETAHIKALQRLLRDPELIQQLSRAGIQTASRYSVEAAASSEIDVLRRFLGPLHGATQDRS